MRLRNKKTGRILEAGKILFGNGRIGDALEWNTYQPAVNSLAELNEEWEDYTPTEPLIKDEKVRKAVKAWAEAVGTECVEITHSRSHFIRFMSYLADEDELCMSREIGQIFDEKLYTIAELCGEEEK